MLEVVAQAPACHQAHHEIEVRLAVLHLVVELRILAAAAHVQPPGVGAEHGAQDVGNALVLEDAIVVAQSRQRQPRLQAQLDHAAAGIGVEMAQSGHDAVDAAPARHRRAEAIANARFEFQAYAEFLAEQGVGIRPVALAVARHVILALLHDPRGAPVACQQAVAEGATHRLFAFEFQQAQGGLVAP